MAVRKSSPNAKPELYFEQMRIEHNGTVFSHTVKSTSRDYAEKRVAEFKETAIKALNTSSALVIPSQPQQMYLFDVENKNTPSLADDDVSDVKADDSDHPTQTQSPDLLTFYTKFNLQSQYDQVTVITYHLQKHEGLELVTYADYERAYATLKRAAVKSPTDVGGSVRNTLNRTDYIYSPERGTFAITLPGEAFVKGLIASI